MKSDISGSNIVRSVRIVNLVALLHARVANKDVF